MSEPYIDPTRKRRRVRPLKAMGYMRQLISDPEDTAQVFQIIDALNGDSLRRDFEVFVATEKGRARLTERRQLAAILDDRDQWRPLPPGSVGQAYLSFMEKERFTAAGLVAESERMTPDRSDHDDDLLWFADRLRDAHDLMHVLTGYDTDRLGEAALLAFTHAQESGIGLAFIAVMGGFEIRNNVPRRAKILSVIREGRRHGRAASRIVEEDLVSLMPRPLTEVREELGIARPIAYERALRVIRTAGLDLSRQLPVASPI